MKVPYEQTGRVNQKSRTAAALIAATRGLMAKGTTPTIEQAAGAASISRTTAYRYFPNQRALLAATYPQIEAQSLLGPDPPEDPIARLAIVAEDQTRRILEYEPELRTMLRLSLEQQPSDNPQLLRQGRRIGWIEDALSPLRKRLGQTEFKRLVYGVAATLGIEVFAWLTDIAGLSQAEATELMRSNARTMLASTMAELG